MKPIRVQLSRKEGYEKPPNTVVVSRPSRWGNDARLGFHKVTMPNGHERFATRQECVDAFRARVDSDPAFRDAIVKELRGKNLGCWCPLEQACHADVLLEVANA